jgi:hypothetical protein
MVTSRFVRIGLVLVAVGTIPLAAFGDEIVHFTNGAEMTVRSHSVEKGKNMVTLDLGGSSFIAFPLSMVDKIVSAGRDVFLSPGFHPANQAIGGVSGGAVVDTSIRGTGDPAGFGRQPTVKGTAGVMLGEAADAVPAASIGGLQIDQAVANSRRAFNPLFPPAPGASPQVIMPPGKMLRPPIQIAVVANPQGTPPVGTQTEDNPAAGDPAPENPPDTP